MFLSEWATSKSQVFPGTSVSYRGTFEPGMLADFVVLSADPSADIGNSQRITEVWTLGLNRCLACVVD